MRTPVSYTHLDVYKRQVQSLPQDIIIEQNGDTIDVKRPSENKKHKSLHGLTRSLLNNMIVGTSEGFKKELEINGVGYRAAKQGKKLVMNLGCLLYTSRCV